MISYNEHEMENHFFAENDRALFIKSELPLAKLYEKLLAGEDISSVAEIKGFKGYHEARSVSAPMKEHTTLLFTPIELGTSFNGTVPYEFSGYDGDGDDRHEFAGKLVENEREDQHKRAKIFRDIELESMHLAKSYYGSIDEWTDITNEDLIKEIGDALGIMPNLQKPEIPYDEQVSLSTAGADLFFYKTTMPYNEFNGLPTYEEMKYYKNLPVSQKDMIRLEYDKLHLHPITMLHLIKDKFNGLANVNDTQMAVDELINSLGFYSYRHTEQKTVMTEQEFITQCRADEQMYYDQLKNNDPEFKKLLDDTTALFIEKMRRAPRVINPLVEGFYETGITNPQDIVDSFSVQNVSKVAEYRKPMLFRLTAVLNFNNIKATHIPILGTYITAKNFNTLKDKHFFEWYSAHISEISDKDLVNIFDHQKDIPDLDNSMPVKVLLNNLNNAKALRDKAEYERHYNYSFDDNIVAIKGKELLLKDGPYKLYILDSRDLRNFTSGYDTYCCQHWGGAGSTCTGYLTSEPFSGNMIIEKNGNIVAQSFVWTDEDKDLFVFDNIEFANDADIKTYSHLLTKYVEALPYSNVHCGTGYLAGGLKGWGKPISSEEVGEMSHLVNAVSGRVYTDYHSRDARVFKTGGRSLLFDPKARNVTVERMDVRRESVNDLMSQYELLALPENRWAFQIPNKSMRQRLEILSLKDTINQLSEEEQFAHIEEAPALIININNPSERIQAFVCEHTPALAKNIKNPNHNTIETVIYESPSKIKEIVAEHPDFVISPDFATRLIDKQPTILTTLLNLDCRFDEATLRSFIDIFPRYITKLNRNLITHSLLEYAVRKDPKIISVMDVPADIKNIAITLNPQVGAVMDRGSITDNDQIAMVQADPSTILNLKNPSIEAITAAVRLNPSLIRNFQHQVPELIPECVAAKPEILMDISDRTSYFQFIPDDYRIKNPMLKREVDRWKQAERA